MLGRLDAAASERKSAAGASQSAAGARSLAQGTGPRTMFRAIEVPPAVPRGRALIMETSRTARICQLPKRREPGAMTPPLGSTP